MLSKSLGEVDWRRHFVPVQFPKLDKGIPILEPQEKQFFPDDGTMLVSIGELLIHHNLLRSKREVKERDGKMLVKIVPATDTATFPLFVTRNLTSTFEMWHGDSIIVGNKTVTIW